MRPDEQKPGLEYEDVLHAPLRLQRILHAAADAFSEIMCGGATMSGAGSYENRGMRIRIPRFCVAPHGNKKPLCGSLLGDARCIALHGKRWSLVLT